MAKLDDNLTQEGAHRLAARIRQYWNAQGYTVTVTVIPMHGAIRSDMVGGLPRVKVAVNGNIEHHNSAAA